MLNKLFYFALNAFFKCLVENFLVGSFGNKTHQNGYNDGENHTYSSNKRRASNAVLKRRAKSTAPGVFIVSENNANFSSTTGGSQLLYNKDKSSIEYAFGELTGELEE